MDAAIFVSVGQGLGNLHDVAGDVSGIAVRYVGKCAEAPKVEPFDDVENMSSTNNI